MELILISESKLKIMLTAGDMEDYCISNEYMSYENKDTRKMFGKILEKAKEKTGFDSDTGRLFIQVYPSKIGGCDVYVTNCESGEEPVKRTEKKQNQPKKKKEYCIYSFEKLDDVIGLCSILDNAGYRFESALFCDTEREADGKYYLVLPEEIVQTQQYRKKRGVNKSDLASEYGVRMEHMDFLYYINEDTKNIIEENAVKKISRF